MRIGQMVRYVGSKTFLGDRLVSSTNKHFISVISDFDGVNSKNVKLFDIFIVS